MREWITGFSSKHNYSGPEDANEIMLTIYGPRGGTKCIETLSVEQARLLRDRLDEAIRNIALHNKD